MGVSDLFPGALPTDRTLRAFDLANKAAQWLIHDAIHTEALLLGIIEESGPAAGVLANEGLGLPRAQSAVVEFIGKGEVRPAEPLSFSPRAKRAMRFAADEVQQRDDLYVEPEDMLYGLVREGEGVAAKVLEACGISLEGTRQALLEILRYNLALEMVPSAIQAELERATSRVSLLDALMAEHGLLSWDSVIRRALEPQSLAWKQAQSDPRLRTAAHTMVQQSVLQPHFKAVGLCLSPEHIREVFSGDRKLPSHVFHCPFCWMVTVGVALNLSPDVAVANCVADLRESLLMRLDAQVKGLVLVQQRARSIAEQ